MPLVTSRLARLLLFLVAALLPFLPSAALGVPSPTAKPPIKAKGAVELDDPAGDVGPIETGTADHMVSEPGFDMTHLSITSDGKILKIAATLTAPPGARGGHALDVYLDTDNDKTTGVSQIMGFSNGFGGFEYVLELDSCVDYDDHLGVTCGVTRKAKPTANYGSVRLERFKSKGPYDKEAVLGNGVMTIPKESVKTPLAGSVLTGVVSYEDLKVKPGQTVRIFAGEWTKREKGSAHSPDLCPEIFLTLR
jgi:hypothetical protein